MVCRYRNECRYVLNNSREVLTIRLYCSDVPEPHANIDSEHDSDFLLLRDGIEGEFEKASERFPFNYLGVGVPANEDNSSGLRPKDSSCCSILV